MKTKIRVFGSIAFLLGVIFSFSMAFQPAKKENVEKAEQKVKKDSVITAPVILPVVQDVLPDSVVEKLNKYEALQNELKSATIVTKSKTVDAKAENEVLLKKVVHLESLVQQAPCETPEPPKTETVATEQEKPHNAVVVKPEPRKRSLFNRLFRRK